MNIECPHCNTDNEIELTENIQCNKCEKSFTDLKLSKRQLMSAGTALLLGAFGGYKADAAFEEDRYPLAVEYAIVDTCANSSKNMISVSRYETKRDVCLCALQKTEQSVPYSDYKSDKTLFLNHFKSNARNCS
ncbi:hypothetical protein BZG84_15670 [Salinivibrio sp. PR932]|uniref:hypothetical protein n=1 Tax=Salinivibrio sp. PR932 TaxID=1909492 RepID=UPI0009898436|nr:hypothetical protein [Salinivibrio sp. PR932]OOF13498.1 hypothetical protein BZG84_15670 [Salinivibrio sp. PR932]